jgi:hypothetical protein
LLDAPWLNCAPLWTNCPGALGVLVGTGVPVAVAVGVLVATGVFVGVLVGVFVGTGVPVGVLVGVLVAVGVGVGVGAVFDTVTETAVAVPTFPAASLACAFNVWLPLLTFVLSQAMLYGTLVTGAPSGAPSSRNWTLVTPTLSEALAETVTAAPETVAPLVGAVSETVGAVTSAGAPV